MLNRVQLRWTEQTHRKPRGFLFFYFLKLSEYSENSEGEALRKFRIFRQFALEKR
jgi:hypothetical protein